MIDYQDLPKDVLIRKLERETIARKTTEDILEKKTEELYHANQRTLNLLNHNKGLLEQYKIAVDESAIVSKSDPKGKITYVNQAFCDISGYAEEELIGQPHSILRHPDMPKHVFKEMWKTLIAKKVWKGQVKNRKKNGEPYYVSTTIMPILDQHQKTIEYISIRHDITDIIQLNAEMHDTQKEIVLTLSELGETRSKETGQHVRRVAEYSYQLAKLAGLSEKECQIILAASPMHDIGKLAIPDYILLKPDLLTSEEFDIMKTHSQKGFDVFSKSSRPILKAAAIIAHEHHEKWNGTGYPKGLSGEEIHLYGRISAIADVFDALVSKRVYKEAWTLEESKTFFIEQAGKHFDPRLVDLFLDNFDDFVDIYHSYRDEMT